MNDLKNLEQDLEHYKHAGEQNVKQRTRLTTGKLLGYTAAASSAFVFSATADAAVIYSGVQNIGLNTPVDIDNDGISDINLSVNLSSSANYAYMLTPNEVAFIREPGGNLVKKLSSGSSIGAGANFVFIDGTFRAATTYSNFSAGWPGATPPNTTSGLAGIKIADSGTDIFAWLRFSITNDANGLPVDITLIDWAYEDTGASIIAGATTSPVPLPGSLGLLAMGASGLAAFRRRKKTDKKV